jgi:hypothetical protein
MTGLLGKDFPSETTMRTATPGFHGGFHPNWARKILGNAGASALEVASE